MKKIFLSVVCTFLIYGCKIKGEQQKKCFTAKQVYVEFIPPFTFSEEDTLYIDQKKFSHTYYVDSIKTGDYLLKEELIILQIESKQAKEKTTNIAIARTLARKLINTKKYKILNGPELITTGKLKIERTDKKLIKICHTNGYLVKIDPVY